MRALIIVPVTFHSSSSRVGSTHYPSAAIAYIYWVYANITRARWRLMNDLSYPTLGLQPVPQVDHRLISVDQYGLINRTSGDPVARVAGRARKWLYRRCEPGTTIESGQMVFGAGVAKHYTSTVCTGAGPRLISVTTDRVAVPISARYARSLSFTVSLVAHLPGNS